MKRVGEKMKPRNRFIFWAPRIMAILFILFLAVFSLDVFDNKSGAGEIAVGLLIHNIPSIILAIILIISWKYEIVGAIAFVLAGLLYIILSSMNTWSQWYLALSWSLIIAVPAFIIGILFYLNWLNHR